MAVGGVWSKLVSRRSSLIHRESTGNFIACRLCRLESRLQRFDPGVELAAPIPLERLTRRRNIGETRSFEHLSEPGVAA